MPVSSLEMKAKDRSGEEAKGTSNKDPTWGSWPYY